jgi:hypothetical protein
LTDLSPQTVDLLEQFVETFSDEIMVLINKLPQIGDHVVCGGRSILYVVDLPVYPAHRYLDVVDRFLNFASCLVQAVGRNLHLVEAVLDVGNGFLYITDLVPDFVGGLIQAVVC